MPAFFAYTKMYAKKWWGETVTALKTKKKIMLSDNVKWR